MKAPLSWLKDYVDIDISAEELKQKLFGCGFEVEELYEVGKDISGVVVGEVFTCEKIEGTHLSLCSVDCGDKGNFTICCGADNVKVGIKVPCALIGASVYATAKDHVTVEGVMTIKKGKLRGYDSFGMLCSGVELGVNGDLFDGGDYNGLLILPSNCKNGDDVKPILGLDDYIFDIAITANRPDCQSVLGIAREIASVLGKKIKEPNYSFKGGASGDGFVVKNNAHELCPRYIAHSVKNIKIAPSPLWIRKRLALCGLRSINNIVDITNFVMLELGQPMHAFDVRMLADREIVIRRAKDGEIITTLDGKEFKLNKENLVICDSKKPCALAGIMGGLNSEITQDTPEVLFESAKFARDSIRKTSRSLGQHSDSSSLFEKGVNEYTVTHAMSRALHLVEELKCGQVTSIHVDVVTPHSNVTEKKMTVSISKINALLGIKVPDKDIVRILKNLNFKVEQEGDTLNLVVPLYREDIDGWEDIAEEVIRIYGYDNIKGTFLPSASITNGGFNDAQKAVNKLKSLLAAKGLYEVSTYSFYSEKDLDMLHFDKDAKERKFIRILNPINEDLSIMRTTLAPSMVNIVVRNLRRLNLEGRLFELAKVYIPESLPIKSFPVEKQMLCLGMWGKYDFYSLKGIIESIAEHLHIELKFSPFEKPFLHPGKTAKITCGEKEVGYIGVVAPTVLDELALDKQVVIAELDYDLLKTLAKPFKYSPLPKFAEVTRDLAIVCNKNITCAEIENVIYSSCKYVTAVNLFDIFLGSQVGNNKKSMAFSIVFTPNEEPIEDKVDGFVKKILNNLKTQLDAVLR